MSKTATRYYLKDDEITIDRIKALLEKVSKGIKTSNKYNLTDINVICEGIFGHILNRLYNCNLTALTAEVSPNYVAVDLIDRDAKIAFQVTSRRDRGKITETVNRFIKNELYNDFDNLYVLILNIDPHEYKNMNEQIDIGTHTSFTIENNVIDFQKLIKLIKEKEISRKGFFVEVYDDIKMVFDTGRLLPYNVVRAKEELLIDKKRHLTSPPPYILMCKGYGDVMVTAYIPTSNQGQCMCEIEFRQISLSDVHIVIYEEELKRDYFVNEDVFLNIHSDGRFWNDDDYWMKLGSVKIKTNAHTAYHLYKIINEIGEEYRQLQKNWSKTSQ